MKTKAPPPSSTSKAGTKYTNASGEPIPAAALDAPDHEVRPLTDQQRADVAERVAALRKHKPK